MGLIQIVEGKPTLFTSRSRYESLDQCKRYGYLQYHHLGKGIVPQQVDIALGTGIHIHEVLELIGKYIKQYGWKGEIPESSLGWMFTKTFELYKNAVFGKDGSQYIGFDIHSDVWAYSEEENVSSPLDLGEIDIEQIQKYIFREQIALIEGLVRVFCLRTLPRLMERFKIILVEKEVQYDLVNTDIRIVQESRVDWLLQEKDTKDIYILNFKSAKKYETRVDKGAKHDTQGLAEIYATEQLLKQRGHNKSVHGVIMLYLIKSQRRERIRGSGKYETMSPLIKGYRKLGFEKIEWAHSLYFPNPANESGIGRLGRGWEPFDVFTEFWDEVGGVKGWIDLLAKGDIQPECGDILGKQIVEPVSYFRQDGDIKSWLIQTKAEEFRNFERLVNLQATGDLDSTFPMNRRACHYPKDCPYIRLCWGTEEEKQGVVEFYRERVPHHAEHIGKL